MTEDGAPLGNKNAAGPHQKSGRSRKEEPIYLPSQEFATIQHALNEQYHANIAPRNGKMCEAFIGDYRYTFKSRGFNEYEIYSRTPIDDELKLKKRVLEE